jgi:transcriptional regulator with XRE-family HTH domain
LRGPTEWIVEGRLPQRGSSAFGVLLQRQRLSAGLSQEELAERSGLSRRGISDLERGRRLAPYLATVRRLADALHLSEAERTALLTAARPASTPQDRRTGLVETPQVRPRTDATWTLQVREASGSERAVPLGTAAVTVGRDAECTLVVSSPFVSRRHARIELGPDSPTVTDLGSRNGILVNGARLERPQTLWPGDVLTLGDIRITCQRESIAEPATRSLPPQLVHGADRLCVDAQLHEVRIGTRRLERRLSAQEFELLRYLYEHHERVCSRRELGDMIWGDGNWDPNMLYRLVHRLKEKLEPRPETPCYVQTVPQIGYRLTV